MRLFNSLLLGLALATASYAQQTTQLTDNRLTSAKKDLQFSNNDLAEPELRPLAIDERPDKQQIAAIVAVKGGNNLWRRGQLELAVVSFNDAVELNPQLYAAHVNLGMAQLELKKFSAAQSAFERAIELRPEAAAAWQGLGLAQYYLDQYQPAVKSLEQSQRLAPREARYNNNLGFVYMFVERYDDAITCFKTTLELDKDFLTARIGLCGGYTLARQATDAVGVCLEAAKTNSSAVPRYFLGHAYLDMDDVPKSISAFEEAARIEPGTAKILVSLGYAYFKSNKYERALSYFQRARQMDANTTGALAGIGASYAQLRKYDKAEVVLREAVLREPNDYVNHFNLGVVCLQRKNRECALSQYNYLKLNSDTLAKKLFSSIYGDKVIDVAGYQNKPRR